MSSNGTRQGAAGEKGSRRTAFGACILLALAGHGLLLVVPIDHARKGFHLIQAQPTVLWLAAAPQAAVAPPPLPVQPDANLTVPAQTEAPPAPSPPVVIPTESAPPVDPAPREAAVQADPHAAQDRQPVSPELFARYHPAGDLTSRSFITTPVDLDFKAANAAVTRGGSARFILLISELGKVDQIVIENSTLDESFQSFAMSRFYEARFRPGEIDGLRVPSRLTFEVADSGGAP